MTEMTKAEESTKNGEVQGAEAELQHLRSLLLCELRGPERFFTQGVWSVANVFRSRAQLEFPEDYDKRLLKMDSLSLEETLTGLGAAPGPIERVKEAAEILLDRKYEAWLLTVGDLLTHDGAAEAQQETGMSAVKLLRASIPQAMQTKLILPKLMVTLSPGPFFELWFTNFVVPTQELLTGADKQMAQRAWGQAAMWGVADLDFQMEAEETLAQFALRCAAVAKHVGAGVVALCNSMTPGAAEKTLELLDKVRKG